MSQSYRLKLSRPSLKLRVASRIPARLLATSPILLDTTGGIYTFSLDINAVEDSLLPLLIASLAAEFVLINDVKQVVTASSGTIADDTTLLSVERAAPSTTALALPSVLDVIDGHRISIIDWSTSVTDHAITLTADGSETIMKAATWPIYSNAAQLGSLSIRANQALNGWYIAP